MSSRALSRPFAVAVVGGTAATLGYMYYAGTQTKKQEGPASIYKPTQSAGLNSTENDARMSSKDVREVVQGEKKP